MEVGRWLRDTPSCKAKLRVASQANTLEQALYECFTHFPHEVNYTGVMHGRNSTTQSRDEQLIRLTPQLHQHPQVLRCHWRTQPREVRLPSGHVFSSVSASWLGSSGVPPPC